MRARLTKLGCDGDVIARGYVLLFSSHACTVPHTTTGATHKSELRPLRLGVQRGPGPLHEEVHVMIGPQDVMERAHCSRPIFLSRRLRCISIRRRVSTLVVVMRTPRQRASMPGATPTCTRDRGRVVWFSL